MGIFVGLLLFLLATSPLFAQEPIQTESDLFGTHYYLHGTEMDRSHLGQVLRLQNDHEALASFQASQDSGLLSDIAAGTGLGAIAVAALMDMNDAPHDVTLPDGLFIGGLVLEGGAWLLALESGADENAAIRRYNHLAEHPSDLSLSIPSSSLGLEVFLRL